MTNYIWVTNQKEMIHKYPNAPEGVEFLKHPHRHLFKFKTYIQVYHDDRDIEFILVKRHIDNYLNDLNKNLKTKSCEMISNYLAENLQLNYPNRDIKIEVSEDGENGSLYEYPKSQPLNTS